MLGGGHLAGADRPDRLVGDHHLGQPLVRHLLERLLHLVAQLALGLAALALLLGLAHAEDRLQARRRARRAPSPGARGRSRRSSWRRSEWPSTTPSTPSSVSIARGDLAGEGALRLLVHVLRADRHAAALAAARRTASSAVNGAQHRHLGRAARGVGQQLRQAVAVLVGLRARAPQLPVAGDAAAGAPAQASSSASTPGQLACPRAARARRRRRSRGGPRGRPGRTARARPPSRRRRPRSCPARAATASATARVPAANGSSSNAPIGPFQNTVPGRSRSRRRTRPPCAARCRGPSSRRAPRRRRARGARRRASKRSPSTRSTGSSSRQFAALRLRERLARASSTPSSSTSESPVGMPCARKKREAHRAADQQRVGDVEEAVDQRDLVGDLGAAEHHHERALGRLDDASAA